MIPIKNSDISSVIIDKIISNNGDKTDTVSSYKNDLILQALTQS